MSIFYLKPFSVIFIILFFISCQKITIIDDDNSTTIDKNSSYKNNKPINNKPITKELIAQDDIVLTYQNLPIQIDILSNDSNLDNIKIKSYTTPLYGDVIQSGKSLIYKPDFNFKGSDSFQYTIENKSGKLSSATVYIDVKLDPLKPVSTQTKGAGDSKRDGKTTIVYTIKEFDSAIKNAKPGDIIKVADGIVIGNSYADGHRFSNIAGEEGKPIIITTSKTNPATITSANWKAGIPLSFGKGSKYIIIENLILDGANNSAQQGLNIGGYGFPNKGMAHHITLRNLTVKGSYNAGIKIGVHSHNIIIERCKIYNIGLNRTFGEGIYIGEGNDYTDGANDIIIKDNEIYNTNAEAIDIKIPSYNILIENNYIHNINVNSQGAIVVALNSNFVKYDANVVIRDNIIHNVTTRKYDGNAIVVASGNTWIYDNTIWDIHSYAIDVYQDFNNPKSKNVYIWNNIIWSKYLPRFNVGRTYIGDIGPGGYLADVDEKNNIYPEKRKDNYHLNDSDFIGPIDGNADAGDGPGSGFKLKNSLEYF